MFFLILIQKQESTVSINALQSLFSRGLKTGHYILSDELLQSNNLDSPFSVLSCLQALATIQQVVEFATVDLKAANPELQAVVLRFCQ